MASIAKAHAACKELPGAAYDVKWGKDECCEGIIPGINGKKVGVLLDTGAFASLVTQSTSSTRPRWSS